MSAFCIVNFSQISGIVEGMGSTQTFRGDHVVEHKPPYLAWLVKAFERHVLNTQEGLIPAAPEDANSDDIHIRKAIEKGQPLFTYRPSLNHYSPIRDVADWLAGLEVREPGRYRRLDRMTFSQAIEASRRWHATLARKAESKGSTAIPVDQENAPAVLDCPELGEGWKWYWLKTPEARVLEGDAMGHCVGGGNYEHLSEKEAIFSLRDASNVPRVTLHIQERHVVQAVCKGNSDVAEKYQASVKRATAILGLRLIVASDPVQPLADGKYQPYPAKTLVVKSEMLHSDDSPALIESRGSIVQETWYQYDQVHRDDGPAFVSYSKDGPTTRSWYRNGKLHRVDGPAKEGGDDVCWYYDGKLHRDDGPAYTSPSLNVVQYYRHGKLHRENGPAYESSLRSEWFVDGRRHRLDGPASIISELSHKEEAWYIDDELHRVDGPAIVSEYTNGGFNIGWYINGKLHRDDGPALTTKGRDGYVRQEWWIYGELKKRDRGRKSGDEQAAA